jgi:plasmid maintenance system antidote protein VapI
VHDSNNVALHEAIIQNVASETIALLCQNGANSALLNKEGKSPLHLALELQRFDAVRSMIDHTALTQEQARQMQPLLGDSNDVYLLLNLKYKLKNQRNNPFITVEPRRIPPRSHSPLSWDQFHYVLRHFNKHENDYIFKFIDKHVLCLSASEEVRTLISKHAKACCNYLRETKGLKHGFHQSEASMTFLRRILCSYLTGKYEIEQEASYYIKGLGQYNSNPNAHLDTGSGHSKHSRIAYAYDMGLFRSASADPGVKFAQLPESSRKSITHSIKFSY